MQLFLRRIFGLVAIAASLCLSLQSQAPIHLAPIEILHGKPIAMVTINGRGPFRFIIDTGTGGEAFITHQLAERLALTQSGKVRLNDPSGQGIQHAPMVLIDSLAVAGVEFTAVKAVEHSLSQDDGQCDGLLGFVLFRNYLLTLDFPNRKMLLAEGALEPDGERSVLPLRMPNGVPIVSMNIGEIRVDAQIDSGGTGLSLPERVASRLKFSVEPAAFGRGESLSTRFQIKGAILASSIRLGDYTFDRPFVEINPAFPLANFGSWPMQNFALTFDQKNGWVRFEARQRSLRLAATPAPMRMDTSPTPRPADVNLVPVG